jgi:uncharacterized protein
LKPASRCAAVALLGLLAAACGRKGSIRPPLLLVPQPAENFRAFQQGERIVLEWSYPSSYIDGTTLAEIGAVEIWAADKPANFPGGARLFKMLSKADLAASAENRAPEKKTSLYAFVPQGPDRIGKSLSYAVRIQDTRKKRWSEFSPAASVTYVLVPKPPLDLRVSVAENRIELRWAAPAGNVDGSAPARFKGYNIYRAEIGRAPVRLNARPFSERAFDDPEFVFGKTYTYVVRATATDGEPYAESADSPVAVITPKDVFPPAMPGGLTAAGSGRVITLLWDAGREPDLAGYRVWRREAGRTEFKPLNDRPFAENTYSDTTAVLGTKYEYAVSAVDQAGNESAKSAPVSETLKEPGP